jgi:hypothetical protein
MCCTWGVQNGLKCNTYLVREIDLCPPEDLNVFAEVVVGVDVDAVEGSN